LRRWEERESLSHLLAVLMGNPQRFEFGDVVVGSNPLRTRPSSDGWCFLNEGKRAPPLRLAPRPDEPDDETNTAGSGHSSRRPLLSVDGRGRTSSSSAWTVVKSMTRCCAAAGPKRETPPRLNASPNFFDLQTIISDKRGAGKNKTALSPPRPRCVCQHELKKSMPRVLAAWFLLPSPHRSLWRQEKMRPTRGERLCCCCFF
jgi:hypothetical protein